MIQSHVKLSATWIILVALTGFTLGVLAVTLSKIEIDYKISIGNLIQFLVTIFLAVFVAQFVKRSGSREDREIEIIFKHFHLLDSELDCFKLELTTGNLIEINACLKRLSMCVTSIQSTLNESGPLPTTSGEIGLDRTIRDLRDLSTYTPIDVNSESEISISEGIVQYSPERFSLIHGKIQQIRYKLLKSQFEINRSLI